MSLFLHDFSAWLDQRPNHVHRIAEIHQGEDIAVMERLPATPCQNLYSVAKAYTVTAIGLLWDRGLLSLEETIPQALGRLCPLTYNPLWDKCTVHQLLKHHVGLPQGCLDIDCLVAAQFGRDYLAYAMNHPLLPDHGTVRRYTDAAYYILSCIVENRAGLALDTFLWKELFFPLSFRDAAWSHCPMGHTMGATGLFLRIEDMIKLGAVYLNGGSWQGQRLLSPKWVQTVIENEYEFAQLDGGKAYGKGGMLGQMLMVIPSENRVVAWQAASGLGQEGAISFVSSYRGYSNHYPGSPDR